MSRKHGFFRPHLGRGFPQVASTTLREGGGDIITSIFADGTDGFYFDGSKTDRTWQVFNSAIAADDPGETIGLAFEGSKWSGRSLASELAALTNKITNGDNESALFTSAYGTVSATSGTVARSTDQAASGAASAKFLCNTASSTTHYINIGVIPAGKALYIRCKVYVPTGSIGSFRAVDVADGSWIAVLTSTKDQWVTVTTIRAAKSADWALSLGSNSSESINGQAFYIDDLEIYEVPGNHGVQVTSAARPTRQSGGLYRFDGVDDNLLTTLVPGAAMTLMAKVKPIFGNRSVMGASASGADRAFISLDANGLLCGGVGSQSTGTIVGGSDVRNTIGVAALTFNGTTVSLRWNGVEVYAGAQSGLPTALYGIALGALNAAGTLSSFQSEDLYYALAIKKALPAAQIAAITNLWGTS